MGKTSEILAEYQSTTVINATYKVVMPGFVDPHTHLVFAGSRHDEYQRKIIGETYSQAQQKGGGIQSTVESTRKASKEELTERALKSLDACLLHGTTTLEIKSGYGLDEASEYRILEIVQELKRLHVINIVGTFLGAHTVPEEFKGNRAGYVTLVKSMLPEIKNKGLAEFCDVFCDELGFSVAETRDILTNAKRLGFKLKVHAEQTSYTGGSDLAAELGAVSADHLDFICDPQKVGEDWELKPEHLKKLARSGTVGVLLPGVTYHLMEMIPGAKLNKGFLPATVKLLIDNQIPVALATDYNPGSSRTPSMQAVIQLAARFYRMNYARAINAATINAAYAIDKNTEVGSLELGKRGDVVIYDCEEHGMLIDNFGTNMVDQVIKDGKLVVNNGRLIYR